MDYRYDPFTDSAQYQAITGEIRTIPATSPYTVRLIEVPAKKNPSTISLRVRDLLAAAITTTGATSITATNGAWFATNDVITIDSEQMLVTNVSGATLTVARGYNSTSAETHTLNTPIYGPLWSEVAATPAARQYWPDYATGADGDDNWNTGTLLFNSADAGKTLSVSYTGTGTLADTEAVSRGLVEYFTPGSYTFIVPRGVTQIEIELGGGGGGGSRGGDAEPGAGGGCGEYKPFAPYTVTPGQVLTVSVGAGGPGSTSQSADGTAGGASGVGTLVSCTGGGGGQNEDACGHPAGGAKGGGLYAQNGAGVIDTGGENSTKCAGCGGSLAEASGKIGIGGGSRDASLLADTYALTAKLLRWIAGNYTPKGNGTDAVGVCAGGGGGPQTMSASRGGNGAPGFVRIRY